MPMAELLSDEVITVVFSERHVELMNKINTFCVKTHTVSMLTFSNLASYI